MGLLGDRSASQAQMEREVRGVSVDDLETTAQRIVAAVGPVKTPLFGSKVHLRQKRPEQLGFVYGNKATDFWIVAVELSPAPNGGTAVAARCIKCAKGREVSNFLHETMKPVLDAIEQGAASPA